MWMWKGNWRLPSRATSAPARLLCAVLGAAGLVCLSAAGCGRVTNGSAGSTAHSDPVEPVPGIAPTLPDHIPPNSLSCVASPIGNGHPTAATVSDPAAPRITISVPDGWNSAAGTGDTALTLTGPAGMTGSVKIAPTELPPDSAFMRYTAGVGGSMPRQKFSVTGAQFCGYSSQRLSGTLRGPSGGIDFADRVTHIWTNTKQYLVSIHLEGPVGTADFSTAKSTLTQDFAVVIP